MGDVSQIMSKVMGSAARALGASWFKTPEQVALLRARAVRFQEKLSRVSASKLTTTQLRGRMQWLLRSHDAKFCCLVIGWPAYEPPVDWASLDQMARELDPRRDCGEPILARPKFKKIGYRIICRFGPRRRGLQVLVREILRAAWGPSSFDFAQKGLGRDRAMKAILAKTDTRGGPRWILTADIANCFGSFDREGLKVTLPLPHAVTENTILIPLGAHVIPHHTFTTEHPSEPAVWLGLPQGSLASPYVASKLLEPTLAQMGGKLTVSLADDILAGGATQAEVETIRDALVTLLAAHPAGPLLLKTNVVSRLGKPIDFLGYRLRARSKHFGGGARCTPSPNAFDAFEENMRLRLQHSDYGQLESTADAYLSSWQGAYGAWDRSEAGDTLLWLKVYQDILPPIRKLKAAEWKLELENISAAESDQQSPF